MSKKKIIVTAFAIMLLIAGGYRIARSSSSQNKIDFATEPVRRGYISNFITATGTIEPVTEVEVGTQVSGIIDKIYID